MKISLGNIGVDDLRGLLLFKYPLSITLIPKENTWSKSHQGSQLSAENLLTCFIMGLGTGM